MSSPPARPPRTAQAAELRPQVTEAFHTDELPLTPQRDRTLPARLWMEAPAELVDLGQDLGHDLVTYKRRIGRWLLWRAGPAVDDNARYMAIDADNLDRRFTFTLDAAGDGAGTGPDGVDHTRFRSWKESLRDSDSDGPRGPSRPPRRDVSDA